MKKKSITLLLASITALLLSACSDTPSTDIKTAGFYSQLSVNSASGASTATCTAIFQVGGVTGTYIELAGGDAVYCNGQLMQESKDPILNTISYNATVSIDSSRVFNVNLQRAGEPTYNSTVSLPIGPVLTSPSAGSSVKKGQDLNVQWTAYSNPGTTVQASLSFTESTGSNDVTGFADASADPTAGTLTISGQNYPADPRYPGIWPATLSVSAGAGGNMAAGLSGAISASQGMSLGIQITN